MAPWRVIALGMAPGARPTQAQTGTTITVTPTTPNGWGFNGDGSTGGAGAFVSGPGTPPLGSGSARMVLDNTTTSRHRLATLAFAGTRLADITELEYSTYRSSANAGNNLAIALQFDIDYDPADGIAG